MGLYRVHSNKQHVQDCYCGLPRCCCSPLWSLWLCWPCWCLWSLSICCCLWSLPICLWWIRSLQCRQHRRNCWSRPSCPPRCCWWICCAGRYVANSAGVVHVAKRSADAEPEADADAALLYGAYGYGGYGLGYAGYGYGAYYGKRSADAEPEADAAYLYGAYGYGGYGLGYARYGYGYPYAYGGYGYPYAYGK